jgi:hypothetical protein
MYWWTRSCWLPGNIRTSCSTFVGPIGDYPVEENFDLHDDRALIQELTQFYDTSIWSLFKSTIFRKSPGKGKYLRYLESRLAADVAEKVTFRGFIERAFLQLKPWLPGQNNYSPPVAFANNVSTPMQRLPHSNRTCYRAL